MKRIIIMSIVLLSIVASPAMAGLTISNIERMNFGNKNAVVCDVAFDSSYNYQGETLAGVSLGMTQIDKVIATSDKGFSFVYDYTNSKLKALANGPPIVYDEKISITAASGATLTYPAAWVIQVNDSAGNNCLWSSSGATKFNGANRWATNALMERGVRTGITCDAVDTYYVTYVTQAWDEVFNMLVQASPFTVPSTQGSHASPWACPAGHTIFAIGAMNHSGITVFVPYEFGAAAGTSTAQTIGIDYGQSGTSTSYLVPPRGASYVGQQVYMTYLKYPPKGSWLESRYVTFEEAYGVFAGSSIFSVSKPVLIWGTSGEVVNRSGTTNSHLGTSLGTNTTAGVSLAVVQWNIHNLEQAALKWQYQTKFIDQSGVSPVASYAYGYPWEIPGLKPLEVPNGTNLSGLTGVKLIVIGY